MLCRFENLLAQFVVALSQLKNLIAQFAVVFFNFKFLVEKFVIVLFSFKKSFAEFTLRLANCFFKCPALAHTYARMCHCSIPSKSSRTRARKASHGVHAHGRRIRAVVHIGRAFINIWNKKF